MKRNLNEINTITKYVPNEFSFFYNGYLTLTI